MEPVNHTLESILKNSRLKLYPGGQIIIYEGDPSLYVYVIKSGYTKVYDIDSAGNEKILSIVKPNDIMPYSFFSSKEVGNQWFYQAINDNEVYVIDRKIIINAINSDSHLAMTIASNFSKEFHELMSRLSSMNKSRSKDRLIALMHYFVTCIGGTEQCKWWQVPFPVSQQFIADITGMTRETCTATMKILTKANLIRHPGHNILEINTHELR